MKPTQDELATTLYDALLNYEDAFAVMDGKVRNVFNRQMGTIAGLEKQIEELQKANTILMEAMKAINDNTSERATRNESYIAIVDVEAIIGVSK